MPVEHPVLIPAYDGDRDRTLPEAGTHPRGYDVSAYLMPRSDARARPGAGDEYSAGMPAALRLEVFVEDLDVFADFYTRVLGFSLADDRRGEDNPYVSVVRDDVRIGAAPPWQGIDRGARDVPTGVEIVLEVDDVHADLDRVTRAGWPLAQSLQRRPWGLTDFRVHDPDGHYLRLTGRS